MLGPSLLGQIWPNAMYFILPTDTAPYLKIIADIGVILYMFLVGLELNAGLIRSRAHATVAISHTSILVPFLLGTLLALWIYPIFGLRQTPFMSFALFMGIAMSITAFPVLARILTDRRMEDTELGVISISCAAIDDVTAWCLLAFVVGIAQSQVGGAVQTILYAIVYIGIMLIVVRPLAIRYLGPEADHPPRRMAVWVLVGLLVSAMTAEWIGIHAIFGAFLLGAIIPHDAEVARFQAQAGRHRDDSSAARILRLHRHANANSASFRLGSMGILCRHHPGGDARQIRRQLRSGPTDRAQYAACGSAWDFNEHSRTDGADRAQYRPGAKSHIGDPFRDDGHHGPCHHDGHHPSPAPTYGIHGRLCQGGCLSWPTRLGLQDENQLSKTHARRGAVRLVENVLYLWMRGNRA
jgi:hypothetical protein